jgi:DNA-nicking Smr family endonuclease
VRYKQPKKHNNKYNTDKSKLGEHFVPDFSIDFHKFGPMNSYEIEKRVREFVEDSYAAGGNRLLIITGKGKTVRPIAQEILGTSDIVEEYRYAGYFNGQDGALEVILKS